MTAREGNDHWQFLLVLVTYFCDTSYLYSFFSFFFQAEDGIRDPLVTGVQTCALPISPQKERTYYRPAGDALYGGVCGPSQHGGFDLDVDLPLPAIRDAGVVRAEEVEPIPPGHPTED